MCGPIFDDISNNGQSKMRQEKPENRRFQASRGYLAEAAEPRVTPKQVMPARTRAALPELATA